MRPACSADGFGAPMRTGARAELKCCLKTRVFVSDGVALRQYASGNDNE